MAIVSNKRGLADNVYEQLKEWMFESRFSPGDRLPVDDIATEMSVSRQPVMDAMKRLELEGFVSIVPQVGCKVREYSRESLHDFYLLLAYAEGLTAELAVEKATEEDLINLRVISEQIGRISGQKLATPDMARLYRTLNRKFHKEIRRIARSPSMTELVESMGDRSDFFIATSGRSIFAEKQRLKDAHVEHEGVLKAFFARDAKQAGKAMKAHILETDVAMQEHLRGREEAAIASTKSNADAQQAPAAKKRRALAT